MREHVIPREYYHNLVFAWIQGKIQGRVQGRDQGGTGTSWNLIDPPDFVSFVQVFEHGRIFQLYSMMYVFAQKQLTVNKYWLPCAPYWIRNCAWMLDILSAPWLKLWPPWPPMYKIPWSAAAWILNFFLNNHSDLLSLQFDMQGICFTTAPEWVSMLFHESQASASEQFYKPLPD